MSKTAIKNKRSDFNSHSLGKAKSSDAWTIEEEQLLTTIMDSHNLEDVSWVKVAKQLPGRSAGHCQAKWQDILKRDSKKGNWTEEEDQMLKKWVRSTNYRSLTMELLNGQAVLKSFLGVMGNSAENVG